MTLEKKVAEIRTGESQRLVAAIFCIARSTVGNIGSGKTGISIKSRLKIEAHVTAIMFAKKRCIRIVLEWLEAQDPCTDPAHLLLVKIVTAKSKRTA